MPRWLARQTYKGQRIAEEHKTRGMVWELVGKLLDVCVDFAVQRPYLERLLIDLIYRAQLSASLLVNSAGREQWNSDRGLVRPAYR